MSTRVSIQGSGNEAMHKSLCVINEQYLTKFKKAASTNKDLDWLVTGIEKYKRDVSKSSRFVLQDDQLNNRYPARQSEEERLKCADAVLRQLIKGTWSGEIGLAKAGVTTSLGYNFIDLRGPANLLYPVNTPFRDQIARTGAVNAGVGTMAQWKTTRVVGSQYAGVPEGQRAQVAAPDENNFATSYKALGVERNVTVEAEWAGEGFTGNLADEHLRGLQELWLQEEGIILLGNDGTGSLGQNGFALGTAPAPVAALVAGGSVTTATLLTGYVVLLTGLGNPNNAQYGYQAAPSVTNGLVPSFSVTAPGTGATITYNGGMSAISAASNSVTTTGGNLSASFTVKPNSTVGTGGYPNGTFGFAWFISSNATPTTANAWLQAITQFPTYTQLTNPTTSGQAANATGLSTDHSSQPTDFTGLISWAATYGYWKDLQGAQLTSAQGGQCVEINTALEFFFTSYQAGVDAIWGSPDAVTSLQNTILKNGSQAASGYTVYQTRDNQNNITGGLIVSGYQSRYAVDSPTGANVIPIKMHPMIPQGTIYFDIMKNPYPQSRIPATREIFLMRDYYGYEWPAINRAWAFGTYSNECLAHFTPWLSGVITGIGLS
jgi:hypothetical protein